MLVHRLACHVDTYVVTMYRGICASVSTFPGITFIVPRCSIDPATSGSRDFDFLDFSVKSFRWVEGGGPVRTFGSRWCTVIDDRSSVAKSYAQSEEREPRAARRKLREMFGKSTTAYRTVCLARSWLTDKRSLGPSVVVTRAVRMHRRDVLLAVRTYARALSPSTIVGEIIAEQILDHRRSLIDSRHRSADISDRTRIDSTPLLLFTSSVLPPRPASITVIIHGHTRNYLTLPR